MAAIEETSRSVPIEIIGFKLAASEREAVNKIIVKGWDKLAQKYSCEKLRIRLKQHERGKTFTHEIDAEAVLHHNGKGIILSSSVTDYNLLAAVAEVMEKLQTEAGHKTKLKK